MIDTTIRDWVAECESRRNEDGEIDFYSCVGCMYTELCAHLDGGYPVCDFRVKE